MSDNFHRVKAGTFNNEGEGKKKAPTKRKPRHRPIQAAVSMIAQRYDSSRCVSCRQPRNSDGYPVCNDCGRRNTTRRPT